MTPLHRWPHCFSLKSKWLPRNFHRRFQMSCKAFFSAKSPYITLRLGKCLIKVRICCLLYLNLAGFFTNYAIFLKLCDRMRLCEIAPTRDIRWPVIVTWILLILGTVCFEGFSDTFFPGKWDITGNFKVGKSFCHSWMRVHCTL